MSSSVVLKDDTFDAICFIMLINERGRNGPPFKQKKKKKKKKKEKILVIACKL